MRRFSGGVQLPEEGAHLLGLHISISATGKAFTLHYKLYTLITVDLGS